MNLRKIQPFFCLQETHLIGKDPHKQKVKEWKIIFKTNEIQKKGEVGLAQVYSTYLKSTEFKSQYHQCIPRE
jgi:hypothetical protein